MKLFSSLVAITLAHQCRPATALGDQQQGLRGKETGDNSPPFQWHQEPHISSRDLSQEDDEQCKEVYRRPLLGVSGDTSKSVSKNKGWVEVSKQYGPFGYGSPDPQPNTVRKWRVYAVYWDENSGGRSNVQIRIENGDDVVFTMPRIAGGWGWKAGHFSDFYQKGSGSAEEINKSHAVISARLDSTAPYNNHGALYAVDLLAYDCKIKKPEMCKVIIERKEGGWGSDENWSLNNMFAFKDGVKFPVTEPAGLTGLHSGSSILEFYIEDTVNALAFASQDALAFDLTVTGCSNGNKGPGYMKAVHWSNGGYRDDSENWTAQHNNNKEYWSYNVVHISESPTSEFLPWSALPTCCL